MNFAFPIALLISSAVAAQPLPSPGVAQSPRQRLIVLTDIENEPDDTQSLVRLLLYANDIDIRGLVATTSTHLRDRVAPQSIHDVIQAYGKVLPNLRLHSSLYPSANSLHAVVCSGLPRYGMKGVGDGCASLGSELIIRELLRSDDIRPLWIAAWGGTAVLAQALWQLRSSLQPDSFQQLLARLRVYAIADQDDSSHWLCSEFPSLFYITSGPFYDRGAWSHMADDSPVAENGLFSSQWLTTNIQQGHGPLGAAYPDTAYATEGDSPSWLGLIPNGLNNMEHPDWGGWGGRFLLSIPTCNPQQEPSFNVPNLPESRPLWHDAPDTIRPGSTATSSASTAWGLQRWRGDFQRDFAARMLWCTENYSNANHYPSVNVQMWSAPMPHTDVSSPPTPIPDFTIQGGHCFRLHASATDPDGDSLTFLWSTYPEVTNPPEPLLPLCSNVMHDMSFLAPRVANPSLFHIILKVSDKGSPALCSYCRVIIKVI